MNRWYCDKCGKELLLSAKYCRYCGHEQEVADKPTTGAEPTDTEIPGPGSFQDVIERNQGPRSSPPNSIDGVFYDPITLVLLLLCCNPLALIAAIVAIVSTRTPPLGAELGLSPLLVR